MTAFKIVEGQAIVQVLLAEPAVGLLGDMPKLAGAVLKRLETLGLRLEDMKLEWGDQTLSEIHLRAYLFGFRSTLNVYASRVELRSRINEVTPQQQSVAIQGAVNAVQDLSSELTPKAIVTDLGLHGEIDGGPAEFCARFTRNDLALGPAAGSGCVFYFGRDGEKTSSTFTVDMSVVVDRGLYVRSLVNWDGSAIQVADSLHRASQHLTQSLEAVGLVWPASA